MAETPNIPPKTNPEELVLRAAPRRAMRFNRKLLMGSAALISCGLFAVMALALQSPSASTQAAAQETFNTEQKTVAEGIDKLKPSYAGNQPPALGAPLPGDLGGAMLEHQRSLGVSADGQASGYYQNEEASARRAERLRVAQQARQAKEASVFFPLSKSRAESGATSSASGPYGSGGGMSNGAPSLGLDPDRDQNYQERKLAFMNKPGEQSIYNPYPLQDAVSPYQVMAGSVIAASLVTGINSDLPGLVTAQITENIFDTVSGRYLLIPQGSRLIGSYDSVVAFGQSRALLVWQRIVMPDGSSIQIENLPATDAAGYAGLADKLDFHTWRLLKGVVLSTLLGVGTELSLGSDESDLVRAIRESTQQNVNRAGQRITEKNLNIQPTITVRPGWPLRIIVHKDLILRPYKG